MESHPLYVFKVTVRLTLILETGIEPVPSLLECSTTILLQKPYFYFYCYIFLNSISIISFSLNLVNYFFQLFLKFLFLFSLFLPHFYYILTQLDYFVNYFFNYFWKFLIYLYMSFITFVWQSHLHVLFKSFCNSSLLVLASLLNSYCL